MARAASASKGMGMDAFLDHGEGGGAKFLQINFKKEDEYNVWLHPRSEIFVLWRVVWRSMSDDGEKIRLWRWNSMEDEHFLDKQRFTNDDGTFQHSPKVDPFALLLEWVGTQVVAGNIDWCDEIFKWEPSDADDVSIHAGGFTGMFQKRDLDKEKRQEMRKAGVRQDMAFMEDARAQEETVLCVIDNDNPGNGPQIASIKRGLAKALRQKVKDRRKEFSKTPEKADPFKTPVCFSFEKDDSGEGFPKYSVTALSEDVAPLTDEIKAAFELDPPDTSKMQEQSNVAQLRKSFEEHWCHEATPPWDEIFKEAEEAVKGTAAAREPEPSKSAPRASAKNEDDEEEEKPKKAPKEEKKSVKPAPKVVEPEETEEEDEESEEEETEEASGEEAGAVCESCDGELGAELFANGAKEITCPHCGAGYDLDPDTEEWVLRKKKEEKPKVRASKRPKD